MHAVSTNQIADILRFNDNGKYFPRFSNFPIIQQPKLQDMRNSENISHIALGTVW